jgi:hypothetical protein
VSQRWAERLRCRNVNALLTGAPFPSRLTDANELVGQPHSWTAGDLAKFCRMVGPESGAAEVAIVGNGPLSNEQREAIAAADVVVRFNAMNNRQCRNQAYVPFSDRGSS